MKAFRYAGKGTAAILTAALLTAALLAGCGSSGSGKEAAASSAAEKAASSAAESVSTAAEAASSAAEAASSAAETASSAAEAASAAEEKAADAVYRTLEEIQEDGTINIGVFSDKNPFGYVDENGDYQGYDVYFAKRIGEDLGVEIHYVSTEAANRVVSAQVVMKRMLEDLI